MTKHLLGSVAIAAIAAPALAQDADLLVLSYSGYEDPAYHTAYTEAHGDDPTFSFFGDEEEAFQKIVSGFQADTAHICAGSVTKWVEAGIIEPWDTSKIDAFADLNTDLTGTSVTSGTEELYFLPADFGSTAIAYNPEEVGEEAVQTLDVFKDPAYAGRMTIPDNVDDAYALAYLATGVTDWSTATDEQFEAASQFLRDIHPNLRAYWGDAAELSQLMATGEILISWAWNETYPTLRDEGHPVAFEREPEEGSSLWVCGFVNLVDGPGSEDKVYDYVNAFLSDTSAVPLMENGFGTANQAALVDTFSDEDLEAAGLEPIDAPVLAQLPIPQELREKHSETFELIKAGF